MTLNAHRDYLALFLNPPRKPNVAGGTGAKAQRSRKNVASWLEEKLLNQYRSCVEPAVTSFLLAACP